MSSEGEKRKHAGDDAVSARKQQQVREEVTDEEVEEFGAILRRMNTAVKYFKSDGDQGPRWRESLEEQISREVKEMMGSRSLDLDLNENPPPE